MLHGTNNIYESVTNIYKGPDAPATVGPLRKAYHAGLGDVRTGNITYHAIDLSLSAYGLLREVRKPDTFELFIRDPINYEKSYKQMGALGLAFEALTDSITIKNLYRDATIKNEK